MRLRIDGVPRTAKNSQRIVTNKKTGKPFIIAGKSAGGWGKSAVEQIRAQWKFKSCAFGLTQSVQVKALIYRDRRIGDLDNYAHAIGDALQKAGIIANDKQIESWDGTRKLIDRENPRVEIEIEPFEG